MTTHTPTANSLKPAKINGQRRILIQAGLLAPLLWGCSDRGTDTPAAGAGGGSAGPEDAALDTLYRQAVDAGETEVVLYTAFSGSTVVWDAFSQRFPKLRVVAAPAAAASLFTRLAAEKQSGNHAGDLVLSGFSDMAELVRQGLLVPDDPSTAAGLPAQYREPGGHYQMPWVNVFTIAYNTNLIQEEALPRTLAEVLDPRWKGVSAFPRLAGTSVSDVVLATLAYNGRIGDRELAALRDQARQLDMGELVKAVGQGRIPFSLWTPAQSIAILAESGAPVKQIFPADVAVLFGPGVGLLDRAPHPHAARLFKNWLFTPPAQQVIAAQLHSYGTMPGAPLPAGFPPLSHYPQKDLPLADANRLLAEFRQRTLAIWKDA